MRVFKEKEAEKNKEYKVRTKGKFADSYVCNLRDHYIRDMGWKGKANPEAAENERTYYIRDYQLLKKKRD